MVCVCVCVREREREGVREPGDEEEGVDRRDVNGAEKLRIVRDERR